MKVHESTWLDVTARQHGAISHRQLVQAGLTSCQIGWRVSNGLLVAMHRGVYRLAGVPPSFEQAAMAACLAVGGIASHRAAAALWELRGFRPGPIEVTVYRRRQPELDGVAGHTTAHLQPVDVTERLSIPVTTPARTLLDLAAVASPERIESALEDALHRQLVSASWLERTVGRPWTRTRRGSGLVAEMLARRDDAQAPTQSILEDKLVRLLREAGLPEPVRQHPVPVPGGGLVFIDMAFLSRLVAVETQGFAFHSSRADLQRDCDKRNLLVRLGWRVLVFTWQDVTRRPAEVVAAVGAALAA